MLALGNPLHAFDFSLAGGRIVVRARDAGEKLRTLDGVDRELDADDLVIADAERGIAIAGIMGGEETEVATDHRLLLEAANFEPYGLCPLGAPDCARRARTAGRRASTRTSPGRRRSPPSSSSSSRARAGSATPMCTGGCPRRRSSASAPSVPTSCSGSRRRPRAARDLAGFGFDATTAERDRPDLAGRDVTREVDLIEEVARFRLEDVPFTLPRAAPCSARSRRDSACGAGSRTCSSGSGSPRPTRRARAGGRRARRLALPEPMGELAALRQTLLHGLVEAAGRNVDAGTSGSALFEIARVYLAQGDAAGGAAARWRHRRGRLPAAKGVVEALYGALKVELDRARRSGRSSIPGRRRASTRAAGRAPSEPPRRNLGRLRARPRRAARSVARPDPTRT